MSYAETRDRLNGYREKIAALREEMRKEQAQAPNEEVADHTFKTLTGDVKLSQLFGDKQDLFIVHNMGTKCSSCTMWADGLNGVYPHLADRASFVIASPDAPSVQRAFAGDRGWRFPMVSDEDAKFGCAMGYTDPKNAKSPWPGVSVFRKDGNKIMRMSDTGLGPRDDFCIVWHLLDLLPEGSDSFRPKFRYFAS